MLRKVNYGKIVAVIFLTVLIWVRADLAKTEEFPVSGSTISITKPGNLNLWVSFNEGFSVTIDKIVLKGSVSRIAKLKRKLRYGILELFLDIEQEEMMTEPGEHPLNVRKFLRENEQIQQLGLTVESCEPDTFYVKVVELVEKSLVVKCVSADEDQSLEGAVVEPSQVNMVVPKDWTPEKQVAEVKLTRKEIVRARSSAVEKVPYIRLSPKQIREVPTTVKVTMPPAEDLRRSYTITSTRLGYNLSSILQGKYVVQVANLDEVISSISIKATPEAKRAYDNMRYHVILEIDDSDKDVKSAEPLKKELVYNFPLEYVRKDEIVLNQPPRVAKYRLVPASVQEQQKL